MSWRSRREGLIEAGQQVFAHVVRAGVAVPTVAVGAVPEHRDEPGARLEHPASHQRRLAEQMPPVLVADPRWFAADVERAAHRLRGHQAHRPGLQAAIFAHGASLVEMASSRVELIDQPDPARGCGRESRRRGRRAPWIRKSSSSSPQSRKYGLSFGPRLVIRVARAS